MPDTVDKPAPTQPRASPIDRSGHPLARRVRMLGARLRTLPSEVWGVAAAFGALVLLLIVLAVASGDNTAAPIPENTPAELREPLAELHEAVDEAEAPGLAATLDDVDAAVESGELASARNAVDELVDATARTLVAEDISDGQADQIFEAARDVLAELPESVRKRN